MTTSHALTAEPVVAHELPDHVIVHQIPMDSVEPLLHARAIGGGAYGIVSASTAVTDGRWITTICTEDGSTWTTPSGDGARVVLRSDLRP